MEKYNGWANHATWNVALWFSNDKGLYNLARESGDYATFRDSLRELGITETPDGVAYNDSALDTNELNEAIQEFTA